MQTEAQINACDLEKIWIDYKNTHSIAIRDQLITHYLHLVKWAVNKLTSGFPPHVKVDDLYSPGVVGLIKAIEKYDLTLKNKFETYALFVIRGAILDEIREMDWVPRSVHKKSNKVMQSQEELRQKLNREPTDKELAKHLKITESELEDLFSYIRPAILIPLNAPTDSEDDQGPLCDRIADDKAKSSYDIADHNEFKRLLEEAVMALPEQERMVLVLYYYENLMLKEIGQIINVSESRVSQIHTKALLRLRKRLENFKLEFSDIF